MLPAPVSPTSNSTPTASGMVHACVAMLVGIPSEPPGRNRAERHPAGHSKYSQGESNPCLQDENLTPTDQKPFQQGVFDTDNRTLADFLVSLLSQYPELATVTTAWGSLPQAVRRGIVAMVQASSGAAEGSATQDSEAT